jgi:hypothetical protein
VCTATAARRQEFVFSLLLVVRVRVTFESFDVVVPRVGATWCTGDRAGVVLIGERSDRVLYM